MNQVVPETALVEVLVEDRVVVIRRTSRTESASHLIAAYSFAIEAAGERADEDEDLGPGVIIDVRLAPGRNDPEFETELVRLHRRLGERFDPIVTLMRSSVGVLQARRLARQLGLSEVIVQDIAEALALCGAPTPAALQSSG